jgi:hypothetical protein
VTVGRIHAQADDLAPLGPDVGEEAGQPVVPLMSIACS